MRSRRFFAENLVTTRVSFHSIHVEVNAHVLVAFDGVPPFDRRDEAPSMQRRYEDLIEPRIRCRLDELDVERSVRVNDESHNCDEPIPLFAKVVRQFG